jgi:hypothetical protein
MGRVTTRTVATRSIAFDCVRWPLCWYDEQRSMAIARHERVAFSRVGVVLPVEQENSI